MLEKKKTPIKNKTADIQPLHAGRAEHSRTLFLLGKSFGWNLSALPSVVSNENNKESKEDHIR